MTQLPVPDMGLLMNAYGKLGARQGRAKQRQQDLENALKTESLAAQIRSQEIAAAQNQRRLQMAQEQQMRDSAMSVARLYADDNYRRATLEQSAAADTTRTLNDAVGERMKLGTSANLTPEAKSQHNTQVAKLQAILKARSASNRPWQYDEALAKWVGEYDSLGIPNQIAPQPEPRPLIVDGVNYGLQMPDGKIVPTPQAKPTPMTFDQLPAEPRAAFIADPKLFDTYQTKALDLYKQEFADAEAAKAAEADAEWDKWNSLSLEEKQKKKEPVIYTPRKTPPPLPPPELNRRAGELYKQNYEYFNPPAPANPHLPPSQRDSWYSTPQQYDSTQRAAAQRSQDMGRQVQAYNEDGTYYNGGSVEPLSASPLQTQQVVNPTRQPAPLPPQVSLLEPGKLYVGVDGTLGIWNPQTGKFDEVK